MTYSKILLLELEEAEEMLNLEVGVEEEVEEEDEVLEEQLLLDRTSLEIMVLLINKK